MRTRSARTARPSRAPSRPCPRPAPPIASATSCDPRPAHPGRFLGTDIDHWRKDTQCAVGGCLGGARKTPRDEPAGQRRASRRILARVRPPIELSLILLVLAGRAHADGERTPMFGGSVLAVHDGSRAELVGVELEMAWWWRRVGLAVEGAQRHAITDGDGIGTTTLGASARLLVAD